MQAGRLAAALIAQMLNQPAFLIVPSGFSTISVSLRGRLEIVPGPGASTANGTREQEQSDTMP